MHKISKIVLPLFVLLALQSVIAQNTWTSKPDVPCVVSGASRTAAVGFSIGSKGYMGMGHDGNYSYYNDFWAWDQTTGSWTQIADITYVTSTVARGGAVGFSIGTKGYIGTGYDANGNTTDFYEYDPSSNSWTQKAAFPGSARNSAVGFSIGSKGYIGTGYDVNGNTKDFYEYDPLSDSWTAKTDFPGDPRGGAVGFSIGSKGYIGTGDAYDAVNHPTQYLRKDFWEYDPAANAWTQKSDFGGNARLQAVGFAIGTKGYIGTGQDMATSPLLTDYWEFNPAANAWTQVVVSGNTPPHRQNRSCWIFNRRQRIFGNRK